MMVSLSFNSKLLSGMGTPVDEDAAYVDADLNGM
jgi:hypothetical protein